MRVRLRDEHFVDIVHRVSAAVLGVLLALFAVGGFATEPAFFSTRGPMVLGMFTNGALSAVSAIAAIVLLASAFWGGRIASSVATGMGVVFLLSGLVHLVLINTPANVLAFRLPNVFFSLIAGMVLAFLGLYGRVSGGLPPDNPYRRSNPRHSRRPGPQEQLAADRDPKLDDEGYQTMLRAEMAVGEGTADARQQKMVYDDQAQRRSAEHQRAYRHARETASADQFATGTDERGAEERGHNEADDSGRAPQDEDR